MIYISTMNFTQKTSLDQSELVPWTTKDQRWSSLVPSIFGLVLDWLQSMVVCFRHKNQTKLDFQTLIGIG